jgi:hypothetical protein
VHLPGAHIAVLAASRRPSLRIALLRILRELALARMPGGRYLQLHAAALGNADGGLILCGDRRAGKTSLLLHLLRSGRLDFISNDRAIAFVSTDGDVMARGMPTVVSIRAGTCGLLPGLQLDRIAAWKARMTLAEALDLPEMGAGELRNVRPQSLPVNARVAKLSLSPAHLCHWLRVAPRAEAPLSVLLFPRVDPRQKGIGLSRLSPQNLAQRIESAQLPPAASMLNGWPDVPVAASSPRLPRQIADRVPGYDCVLGPDAYDDPASGEALFVLARRAAAGCETFD